MAKIRRILPKLRDPETWSLLHHNAPSHTSLIVRQFWLEIKSMCRIIHRIHLIWPRAISFYHIPKIEIEVKRMFF